MGLGALEHLIIGRIYTGPEVQLVPLHLLGIGAQLRRQLLSGEVAVAGWVLQLLWGLGHHVGLCGGIEHPRVLGAAGGDVEREVAHFDLVHEFLPGSELGETGPCLYQVTLGI